jgi:hypothetical protein
MCFASIFGAKIDKGIEKTKFLLILIKAFIVFVGDILPLRGEDSRNGHI